MAGDTGIEMGRIALSLHPLERKVLPHIKSGSFASVSKAADLPEAEISRPLQWLQEKGLVKITEKSSELIELGRNGKIYSKKGLPEYSLLNFLSKPKSMDEIKSSSGLGQDEISASIGLLRKKGLIEFKDGKISALTSALIPALAPAVSSKSSEKTKTKAFPEEELLKKLPAEISELSGNEKDVLEDLKKRKDIIRLETRKEFSVEITELGKKAQKFKLDAVVDNITPEIMASGSWKNQAFRRYDINVPAKQIYAGRRHFVREASEYVKKIWLELGFKEMKGNMIQTSFWNFDALFTAQDHPVRDLQDTFFIKEPKSGKLPDEKLVNAVKAVHETGGNTGSKGWQYSWNEKEARKNVLRTHTTVLSAKTIAALKSSELPAKFFSVGECFRNETLDWSHLFEFLQAEGIVIDEDANMRNLLGYLKEFFRKMGYEKVRTRPAYFPYTEPSMEIDVYHPVHKKWVELGGSGIFRPEVTVPLLGKDVPVLAWGIGLGRIIPEYFGISDIRDLYKNDLKQLREMKVWMK